ncbi:MAG: tetratricopeptide repeat protein [Actinobacteria bacterium]|nr:tetratricopeptide repeat protein [Actinomycetota bacterium]
MDDPGGPALRFSVLGPLRVVRGETALDLGPIQQRVVLAVLSLQAGRPVGRQQMINAVWGEAPPRHAVNLVQRHVSGLRRVLEPGRPGHTPSGLLTWTDAGYLLTLPVGALDLDRYEDTVAGARTARAAGRLAEAAEALRAALRLWRGPVCDGLYSPFLDAQRDRLAESRISVIEERIDLELATGDHADVIAELRDLVAEYPLRERLHGQLMLALYRAGRQADALAAFRDARRRLDEELGVEPAAPLQRLHQQILAADPQLAAPAADDLAADAGPMPGTRRPRPAQLPHPISDFTGRDAELDRLDALLAAADRDPGTSVLITAITGTAGVGKTALAVHWAHRISERFPDGQLYVNLRGFDPAGSAMRPAEAIRGFLDAFGVAPQQLPTSLEAQAGLYRSLLAGRRVLVLLDNAADEDQVRPLLPGSPGCLVVVTSRNDLPGLIVTEGAQPVLVDLMSTAEARQLLSRRIGQSRVQAETRAADDIIVLCARLPLALMLVAARAATHPQFSLSALAAELREAGGMLDAFDGEDQVTNVRAVFSWSYRRLSLAGQRLFRLLGLHFGPDISLPAVASLAGMSRDQARPALAELARAHLVTERVPGRFALHDLLRAYATEAAYAHDPEEYRVAARQRMLDHYLHTACRAGNLLSRHRDRPFTPAGPSPGVTPESPADQKQALAWFEAEHAVLSAALRHSVGLDTQVWQLAWVLAASFFEFQGHWRDWRDTQRIALDASRRLADTAAQAHSHVLLGSVSVRLSNYEHARRHLEHALELFGLRGDGVGQADAHNGFIFMLDQQGLYQEALPHAREALALYQAAGHRTGQGRALNDLGWCHARLGHHEQALLYCQQALGLQREIGDQFGEATTYDSLGYVHRHLGHRHEAVLCYQHAAGLYREIGDLYNEADTLVSLGDAHQSFGDSELARIAWQDALTILEQFGDLPAERVLARMGAPEQYAAPIPAAGRHRGNETPLGPPAVQRPRQRHKITRYTTGP